MTTLDWYGCKTFRRKTARLQIFLDACIDSAKNAPGAGLTARDIDTCELLTLSYLDGTSILPVP